MDKLFHSFTRRLRDIKITYNHIKNIQARTETIVKELAKRNVLTEEIRQEIVAAKSLDELDHLVSASANKIESILIESNIL